jgi:hypothetical protein
MIRSMILFSEFPHPATGPGPEHLARLSGLLGMAALEQAWSEITGDALPGVVRDYVNEFLREETGSE